MATCMNNRVKTAFLVILAQAAATLIISVIMFATADTHSALSATMGGVVSLLVTGIFSARVMLGKMEWSPERFMQRLYRAEMQKIILAAVLLFAALKWLAFAPLPLLAAFLLTMMASWFVLLAKI